MHYRVIRTNVKDSEGGRYRTYGITTNGLRIEDISFDKQQVKQLVTLFNKLKLDKAHMSYAVEDFLLRNCNISG
jgi:hypothetical protein